MSRLRTDIVYLFSALLVSGLLASTLHFHEITDLPNSVADSDSRHTIQQDHLFCPFCSVVFEGTVAENQSPEIPLLLHSELPILDLRIVSSFPFAAKSGRSPPFG
ncbi:MAG: hypothetical protein WD355_07390 [Balneolaceae bacterium]